MAETQNNNNGFSEVMESLLHGMEGVLSSKTVVGQPQVCGDVTIVPLVDVTLGAGAGSTVTDRKGGGGGGFSAKMSPSAVLVIRDGVTKVVNIKNQDPVTKAIDLVPDLVNRFLAGKTEMPADEEVTNIAFPEDDQ
ncbi:MAG: GerW family sporulation protein [Lachnospiraceae bacterium]|nr:GerW family sporulation protein [Lachnospiraceae bacterium]